MCWISCKNGKWLENIHEEVKPFLMSWLLLHMKSSFKVMFYRWLGLNVLILLLKPYLCISSVLSWDLAMIPEAVTLREGNGDK